MATPWYACPSMHTAMYSFTHALYTSSTLLILQVLLGEEEIVSLYFPTHHSVPQHYCPPWGMSFAWAMGVRRDTHSPLLLYTLWKCEHGSVVVVCLAWGLACPSILSLHEHECCSFIEHWSMSSSATLRNEHGCVDCAFIICP